MTRVGPYLGSVESARIEVALNSDVRADAAAGLLGTDGPVDANDVVAGRAHLFQCEVATFWEHALDAWKNVRSGDAGLDKCSSRMGTRRTVISSM